MPCPWIGIPDKDVNSLQSPYICFMQCIARSQQDYFVLVDKISLKKYGQAKELEYWDNFEIQEWSREISLLYFKIYYITRVIETVVEG